jgi:cytidine deaminase
MTSISEEDWHSLSERAWRVRKNARVHGRTQVGVAVLASNSEIYVGCNVEHRFRSHDVHAEVNALTSMAADGDATAWALLIASERDRFTPCGACMDWIFELGGSSCLVGFQPTEDGEVEVRRADELMPFYPH